MEVFRKEKESEEERTKAEENKLKEHVTNLKKTNEKIESGNVDPSLMIDVYQQIDFYIHQYVVNDLDVNDLLIIFKPGDLTDMFFKNLFHLAGHTFDWNMKIENVVQQIRSSVETDDFVIEHDLAVPEETMLDTARIRVRYTESAMYRSMARQFLDSAPWGDLKRLLMTVVSKIEKLNDMVIKERERLRAVDDMLKKAPVEEFEWAANREKKRRKTKVVKW